ncbi:MAG: ABC transporter ATP-binding protein [Vulcanimicrobiota bacterium]
MPLLDIEEVKKTYKVGKIETPALRGVSTKIEEGEFTAVVGPSGSGKTTLINMIGGLDVPDSGRIMLADDEISALEQTQLSDIRRTKIGFIFQAYNLIPVLSAVENVEYVMLLQGVPEKERRKKSEEILEEIGLGGMIHKRPNELSGGQQQRVAVARAIVSHPELVLADEPTANLDSKTSGELLDLMRRLNKEKNITFIFSTHDKLVMERARRIITLKDGMISDDHIKNDKQKD